MRRFARTFVIAVAAAATLAAAPAPKVEGYLKPGMIPDGVAILPPPPAAGSPAEARDRDAFVQTRKAQGTPRWNAAAHDNEIAPETVLADFDCATGAHLGRANTPTLQRIFARVRIDLGPVIGPPKDFYHRPRPFVGTGSPICIAETDELRKSPDYPSGHSTYGWASALILAEIDPAHATAILSRGRAYGESRVVCGVHTPAAVSAGRDNGALLVAALHASPAFRRDVEAARRELARQPHAAPDASCTAEAALLGTTPY